MPNLQQKVLALSEISYRNNNPAQMKDLLLQLDGCAVDESVVSEIDKYVDFLHPAKRKIASVEANRVPAPDELVFIFGSYPSSFSNVIVNNPIRRNILEFWKFQFDCVDSDECWQFVGQIFVINKDDRVDRLYACLRELGRMGAPLDRITRFPALITTSFGNSQLNGTIGCLQSHLAVMKLAHEAGFDNILVLEDDFGFTDEIDLNKIALRQFFERQYSYDVCLVATSKHGLILPKDDLVSYTRQRCTNASAYFVSRSGIAKVICCFEHALYKLIETNDTLKFATDRCWSDLQGERFLVFKHRLGYQLPSFSNIEGVMASYFD